MTDEALPPSATLGFLFADLRGYSAVAENHGDEAAVALLARYRTIVREIIGRFDGAEIRTEGDSFYIVFPSASGAVRCALAILDAAQAADPPIAVGIGVHAGEASDTGEGPVGSAVNIAARVCAQAKSGELLVTDMVRMLTRTRLHARFQSRGARRLKGIPEPIALYSVEPLTGTGDGAAPATSNRARIRPFAIVGTMLIALVVATTALLVRGVGTASPSGSVQASGSPPLAAEATCSQAASGSPSGANAVGSESPPVVADVPAYRVSAERVSVYPGPGPVCQPTIAWQRALGKAANFVPIVVKGEVIVGDQTGLHAFDARTGAPRWTFAGPGGFLESAAADESVVFAADLGGTLHAIDAESGQERWHVPLPNVGIHPLVAQGLVWVGSSDGSAFGLDPATGERRWTWTGPPGVQADVSIVTSETAYIGAGGVLHAVRLVDRSEIWHFDSHGTGLTGPVLGDRTIYVGGRGGGQDALFAIDPATGKNRWGPPFAIASGGQVTPGAVDRDVLYVGTDRDGYYAIRDTGSSYKVLWRNAGVGQVFRPSSLTSGTLYLQQNEGTLMALRARDGATLWETSRGSPAEEAPIVTGGLVFQVDDESNAIRAWAEPGLVALLGEATGAASASPSSQPTLPDPFTVTATYPWFETGISIPSAIAVGPDDLLYVLHAKEDYTDPRVTVFDPRSGRIVRSWGQFGSGPGQLDLTATNGNGPTGCIQVAPNGLVYVGQRGNQRIDVFTPAGKPVRQVGAGQLGDVLFCVLAPDGSIYVGNDEGGPYANEMAKLDPKGSLVWRRLTDPGRPQTAFQVHGFTLLPDGRLLGFIDSGGAVVLNASTGKVVGDWPADPLVGGSGEPSLDSAGNIYVFSYVPFQLLVLDSKGHLLGGRIEPTITSDYQFRSRAFWPPPVFDKAGFGYSFDASGLVQLRVTLPTR